MSNPGVVALLATNGYRAWSSDEDSRLLAMLAAGRSKAAVGAELGRSQNAVQLRYRRLVPFDPESYVPGFGKSPGRRLYWTEERVREALTAFARQHRGQLPNSDHEYSRMKKGHSEWPTASRVLDLFGTMANAWEAIGERRARVTRRWNPWTQEDDDYLLEHAGEQTLKVIAKHLGRSWSACRRRLYDLGAGRARDVSGHLSAMQVASLYGCPLARVEKLIRAGVLPAKKVNGGHYWRIDPEDCERVKKYLAAPKKHSYQGTAADVGDYDKRYGLMRVRREGKVVRVPRTSVLA